MYIVRFSKMRIHKKTKQFTELKNTMAEPKNILKGFNSRIEKVDQFS